MKKITLILALLMLGFTANAQITLQTNGVVHGIQSSNAAAALGDSVHTIGIVDMRNGVAAVDSFQIHCETTDSLNIRYFVVPLQDLSAETVADSTAGAGFVANVSDGGYQFTADGMGLVPWHNIAAAITQQRLGAKVYRIYARVYAVGSELRGNAKTFKTTVRVYQ
jgi:hypothetical protein